MTTSAGFSDRPVVLTPPVVPAWVVGVPATVLVGFLAMFGRAGVGIQILGLPLGAYLTPVPTIAIVGLLATPTGRQILRGLEPSQRRVAIAVSIAVGVGLLRAAAQGVPTLLRFQDMAYILHLPWIVVGMISMRLLASDENRRRVVEWLAWTLAAVLLLHWARGALTSVGELFRILVDVLEPLSDNPTNLMKDGDQITYSVALLTMSLVLLRNEPRRAQHLGLALLSSALLGTHISGLVLGGSRGALLAGVMGAPLALFIASTWRRRAGLIVAISVGFSVTAASLLTLSAQELGFPYADASGPGSDTEVSPEPRTDKPDSLTETYEQRAGRRSIGATLAQLEIENGRLTGSSTVGWRLAIWSDVINEWNASWPNRLFGIGFGNEIAAMTIPGRQGFDGLNRGVHSIAFTILARQGTTGVLAASLVLLSIIALRDRRAQVARPVLVTALVVALFDVFLEGAHAPMLLWLNIGLLLAGPQSLHHQRPSISSKSSV